MSKHTQPFGAWTQNDVERWRTQQNVQRSYALDLAQPIESMSDMFRVSQYGVLEYPQGTYPLYLLQSRQMDPNKPFVMITGGVHGYETSGAHGALQFMYKCAQQYEDRFNFVCAPCVSPWGYETINRWNPDAHDPNRNFYIESPVKECTLLMHAVKNLGVEFLVHFDLHETTDTDNSIFRPALAARDGIFQEVWDIPDGFYLVADVHRPEIEFQQAIIDRVAGVTHIAPSDEDGNIIGQPTLSQGVVAYDARKKKLCKGLTQARFVTTTEVYPDSQNVTPEECIQAQIAAVQGGLDFISNKA